MRAIRTIDTQSPNVSKARLRRAHCLHRHICSDLNPNDFSLEEVREELANPNGNYRLGSERGDKVEVLLKVLVDTSCIEEVRKNSYRVLREAEDSVSEQEVEED